MSKVKPVIQLGVNLHAAANSFEKVLVATKPNLYQRCGMLVRVIEVNDNLDHLDRQRGTPIIRQASRANLRDLASMVAAWERYLFSAQDYVPTKPPKDVIEILEARGSWALRPLFGIIAAPTLRPDGTLIRRPGYDDATGLLMVECGGKFPPIPRKPTLDQADRALDVLAEPFSDFPFNQPSDQSTVMAAILTLVGRHAVLGPVPLFSARAVVAGTGKSLLVDAITTIATGRCAPRGVQVRNDAEERKRLLSIAMAGDPAFLIDNVTYPLGNGALDAALTGITFKDRLLGTNEVVTAPWRTVLFATGNNLTFRGDTGRRAVLMDMNPNCENPEERDDFVHANLLKYLQKRRPRLFVAALTIFHAYFAAGRPSQGLSPFGSFESWSDTVRSALVWAGCADPCEGRHRIRECSDQGREDLNAALKAWHKQYGGAGKPLNEVVYQFDSGVTAKTRDLFLALGALYSRFDGKSLNARCLGHALKKVEGRIIDGLHFESSPGSSSLIWKVVEV